MQKILHTPEGVRDIYKQRMRAEACAAGKAACYDPIIWLPQDIETPTFEYF